MGAFHPHPSLESLESRVLFSNAGDLDTLFSGGKVVTDLLGGNDYGFAVAVQNDGKILVAGQTDSGGSKGNDFAVIRFNSNGSRDTTFGTNGLVTTDLGSTSDAAYAMALQSDGKIVVVGQTSTIGTSSDFAIVRYSTNGTLDATFGTGGKVITDFAGGADQADGVALTADGHIVVSGSASFGGILRFAIARYTATGQLDTSFGSSGKTTTAFSQGYARGQSVVLLPDGSMVVAGAAYNYAADGGDFAAVKYSSSGQLDTTFGNHGWALVDFGADEAAHSILRQSNGDLLLAGEYSNSDTGEADFALTRLTATGALDTTFASGGHVLTDFDGDYDAAFSAALQSDDKIVLAGVAVVDGDAEFGIARYNSNGNLDTTFGSGLVTIGFGTGGDHANAIAIDGQGRIVVAGMTSDDQGAVDLAVARVIGRSNVPPVAQPGSGYVVIAGSSIQLNGSASTDSDGTIVNYEWDFNYDGTTFNTDATGVTTMFSAAGMTGPTTRTIALRVTDNDGATTIATATVTINPLSPPPSPPPAPVSGSFELDADPAKPGYNLLVVNGTSGNDRIDFCSARNGQIEVMLNGAVLGKFSKIDRVIAYGGDGNDVINACCAGVPVELFGGAGNDRLIGGRFNDILVGGDGDDDLWACGGNDLLIGGIGKDTLRGECGNDLLISGGLANQDDASSMQSLLQSWNAPGMTRAKRAALAATLSIIDDATVDHLHGSNCKDVKLAGAGDKRGHDLHCR
jgi:uncharacterized delta-60 repeat protein